MNASDARSPFTALRPGRVKRHVRRHPNTDRKRVSKQSPAHQTAPAALVDASPPGNAPKARESEGRQGPPHRLTSAVGPPGATNRRRPGDGPSRNDWQVDWSLTHALHCSLQEDANALNVRRERV